MFELNIFPGEISECLKNYSVNPKASSCADTELIKVLKKYDSDSEFVHLEDIPENSVFSLKSGRSFIKGEKIRKRYKCIDTRNKKLYLVSPVAEVIQTSFF